VVGGIAVVVVVVEPADGPDGFLTRVSLSTISATSSAMTLISSASSLGQFVAVRLERFYRFLSSWIWASSSLVTRARCSRCSDEIA
jgi:hypothetical protein